MSKGKDQPFGQPVTCDSCSVAFIIEFHQSKRDSDVGKVGEISLSNILEQVGGVSKIGLSLGCE